ncbi:MAG: DUF4878 domain-containing protein [Candidatus Cloacimonetes bacterium]|nr:DUF4878 domain-containing protein [Candidatus Cloacimonadota bacterium]
MKNSLIVMLLIAMLFGAFACKTKQNSPEAVADAFLKAMEKRDFETANKLITEESQGAFDLLQSFVGSMDEEGMGHYEHKILGFELDGNTATVIYEIWTSKDLSDKEEQKLALKKIDGTWKISLEKGDIEK